MPPNPYWARHCDDECRRSENLLHFCVLNGRIHSKIRFLPYVNRRNRVKIPKIVLKTTISHELYIVRQRSAINLTVEKPVEFVNNQMNIHGFSTLSQPAQEKWWKNLKLFEEKCRMPVKDARENPSKEEFNYRFNRLNILLLDNFWMPC